MNLLRTIHTAAGILLVSASVYFAIAAGDRDEAFHANRYERLVTRYTGAEVVVLDGVDHMEIVTGDTIRSVIANWLQEL